MVMFSICVACTDVRWLVTPSNSTNTPIPNQLVILEYAGTNGERIILFIIQTTYKILYITQRKTQP